MNADKREEGFQRILKKLQAHPLHNERLELGRLLMRHIDDLTPTERKRYDELREILKKGND